MQCMTSDMSWRIIIDTFVLIGISLLIYGIAKKGDTMTRKKGIFMILVYVIYMIYIIVR